MGSENRQLFIVDDDISISRALKSLMASHGFKVETFPSAETFFEEVPKTKPGCLILDVMMPGMDGWETQQRLFHTGSRRPVIFISANEDIEGKRRAALRGAVGFLQKPFDDKELVALIDRAMAKSGSDIHRPAQRRRGR
ncbi:MAG: response regulator [Candidatus Firestonebacteria bacterium]|nr:response regulator [Candidatus Firestonebacteria bacterium]